MTVPHLAAVMMMLLLLPAAVAVARNVVWPTVGPCKVTESQTSKVSECRQQREGERGGLGGERGRCIEIAFACQISSRLSVHDDFHDAATTAAQ